jgi:hypothetical protein
MRTIGTTIIVGDDRKLTVQLPLDVAPGLHQVVVVADWPKTGRPQAWTIDEWPVHDPALVDPNFTM